MYGTVLPARMVTSTRVYTLQVNFLTCAYFFQNIHERLLSLFSCPMPLIQCHAFFSYFKVFQMSSILCVANSSEPVLLI